MSLQPLDVISKVLLELLTPVLTLAITGGGRVAGNFLKQLRDKQPSKQTQIKTHFHNNQREIFWAPLIGYLACILILPVAFLINKGIFTRPNLDSQTTFIRNAIVVIAAACVIVPLSGAVFNAFILAGKYKRLGWLCGLIFSVVLSIVALIFLLSAHDLRIIIVSSFGLGILMVDIALFGHNGPENGMDGYPTEEQRKQGRRLVTSLGVAIPLLFISGLGILFIHQNPDRCNMSDLCKKSPIITIATSPVLPTWTPIPITTSYFTIVPGMNSSGAKCDKRGGQWIIFPNDASGSRGTATCLSNGLELTSTRSDADFGESFIPPQHVYVKEYTIDVDISFNTAGSCAAVFTNGFEHHYGGYLFGICSSGLWYIARINNDMSGTRTTLNHGTILAQSTYHLHVSSLPGIQRMVINQAPKSAADSTFANTDTEITGLIVDISSSANYRNFGYTPLPSI